MNDNFSLQTSLGYFTRAKLKLHIKARTQVIVKDAHHRGLKLPLYEVGDRGRGHLKSTYSDHT